MASQCVNDATAIMTCTSRLSTFTCRNSIRKKRNSGGHALNALSYKLFIDYWLIDLFQTALSGNSLGDLDVEIETIISNFFVKNN